jgi:hypothetical protein
MSRQPHIPQRKRIFLGCEGESEQSYGALLQRLANEQNLPLAIDSVILKGGGDPLGYLQLAVSKIEEEEEKRGEYMVRAVLIDKDRLGQNKERDQRIPTLISQHCLQIIWQEPCHEALLLRHLPNCQSLRPVSTELAIKELGRRWPRPPYRKGMPSTRLADVIKMPDILAAAGVDEALHHFLESIGFI